MVKNRCLVPGNMRKGSSDPSILGVGLWNLSLDIVVVVCLLSYNSFCGLSGARELISQSRVPINVVEGWYTTVVKRANR